MRKLTGYSSLACLLIAVGIRTAPAAVPLNQLTEAEKRSGWRMLFDGKTTNGWRNFRKDKVSDGWAVEDGILKWKQKGAGDIISNDQFENFELQIEYRISKGGNSGLFFHVTEEASGVPWTGPEIQIQDNVDGHDPQKSGWLYQLYKPVKPAWAIKFENQVGYKSPDVVDATRPVGQWNHIYLRVTPQQSEVCMNGVSYYYFVKGSKDWDERVSKSKFARHKLFGKAAKGHIALQDHGNLVEFRNIKIRELPADGKAPQPIDGKLALKAVPAFPPGIRWEGYKPIDENGKPQMIRPLQLNGAGDGTNRLFVMNQSGMIHVLANDSKVREAKLFLDLRDRVHQWRTDDEEGLLAMAFHPNYRTNGQFFVYYNNKKKPREIYLSRFRVSKDDPNKADPDSEDVLMTIQQPFANHNGGPMAFGPDGYLYIGMGDGGGRNDPEGLGQATNTFMGGLLRIDVDHHDKGKKYAVPEDNPFTDKKGVLPELYAYGFRNPWRMSFDRKTGHLWLGDVGQDLWEEIDIVKKGGNYGWSIREGSYAFGNVSSGDAQVIDPVWEYDHRIGKSITGGYVYRGAKIPKLQGHYLYADYISGKLWALKYDYRTGKVIHNLEIPWSGLPIVAFGEDDEGEVYVMTPTAPGNGIFRLVDAD